MPNRIDRNAEARKVVYIVSARSRRAARPGPPGAAAPTARRCRPWPPRWCCRCPSAPAGPWSCAPFTVMSCGPRPCISSCIRMCVKKASKDTFARSAGASATFEIGTQDDVELRLLHVLQHHPLAALLADDPLVVGQVEGGGLHAAVAVAGREHEVDDPDRRQRRRASGCGTPDRWAGGPRSPAARRRSAASFCRLRLVAHGDEGLERRLVVEPARPRRPRRVRWSARSTASSSIQASRSRSSRC